MARPLAIAVLVSGEGTTLDGFGEAIAGGHVPGRIALVVADRPYTPAIEKARHRGLPTLVLPTKGISNQDWGRRLDAALAEPNVELVVLAGFLSILPTEFLAKWAGRVVNLHPSLLPKFGGRGLYGMRVHRAVLDAGERESGASMHLVTEDVDAGPVLLQKVVPVEPGDTPERLRERVRPAELDVLFEGVRRFADGRWPLPYPRSAERTPRGESWGASG